MNIVLLDKKTLGSDIDLSVFHKYGTIILHDITSKNDTIERVKNADIIITNKVIIDKDVLDNAPKLKLICVAATGMNNIDLEYASSKDIIVKNVTGYSTNSVVQHTFSLAFYLIGKLKYYDEYVKSENWIKSPVFTHLDKPFFEIANKTWGIIGLGEIGKKVANIASSFGCDIMYYSTSGKNRNNSFQRVTLEKLLKTSDIISIHAPLNKQTTNLLNHTNLNYLKNQAVLLNLGRGGIINEKDLANFIDKSDVLVGLDVLEQEPMQVDNPLKSVEKKENLFISPHIAWASKEARAKLVEGICQNIEDFLGREK